MPIHDWTRVDDGLFHAFHHRWTDSICDSLNAGVLPEGYFALPEQRIRGPIPDVLTLSLARPNGGTLPFNSGSGGAGQPSGSEGLRSAGHSGGLAIAEAPPRVRLIERLTAPSYAQRANRIAIHQHRHGNIVAVMEIVSPGNKASAHEFRKFVEKARELLDQGIHLVVIDLFPPTPRDPEGIHRAIIEDRVEPPKVQLPADKPLLVVSYDAGEDGAAYLDCLAVGDPLPDVPVFLSPGHYVNLPLEATYAEAWRAFPNPLKPLLGASRPGES